MKKIILFLAAVSALLASGVAWEKNLESAADKAINTNKKVMILMSSQQCGYCKQMHREVFSDPTVSAYINDNFVALELDVENDPYPEALSVRGVPTIFFFSPDLKRGLKQVIGPRHPMVFLNILRNLQEEK